MAGMKSIRTRGFSLIEMMIVVCIMLILVSFAVVSYSSMTASNAINSGYATVFTQLRNAREMAIAQRKQYIVCFGVAAPTGAANPLGAPATNSIQLYRWDAGTALSAAVQINNLVLPSNIQFQTITGIPTGAPPDGFGAGIVAIDFDQGVTGGNKQQVMFEPDGSAHDVNGNVNSGVIYLAQNNQLYSSRAVSLFGSSGRTRGWILANHSGVATWVEQ